MAKIGDGKQFKRARQLSSCLGLTAREHSSGGKQRQYGIRKRGDSYLRTLLIHGARSVLRHAARKVDPDPLRRWALRVQARRGANVATVALANTLARIAWAVLAKERHYDPHWAARAA